jgi:predicted GNAT family acetyltransferase
MLDAGCDFCVLYTDLANPTSNAIYRRLGYEMIGEVVDVHLTEAGDP